MIIIQLAGGLGNQMFQYALYRQLQEAGKEVKIDDVTAYVRDEKRTPSLSLFGIDYERPTSGEMVRMLDSSMLPWNRVRRRLFGRKKKAYFEEDKRYHPEIMDWDDIYLEGYWQSEKYFSGIAEEIRRIYDIDRLLDGLRRQQTAQEASGRTAAADAAGMNGAPADAAWERFSSLRRRMESEESVGVHIRGGDYLYPKNQPLYGGICTPSYYRQAMACMRSRHPGCRFYLFTNDREWAAREMLPQIRRDADASDMEIVDAGGLGDYADFALMSCCRHNILANSSFSWWASYLNPRRDKTVLAPERWLGGWDCSDIYRGDMEMVTASSGGTEERN